MQDSANWFLALIVRVLGLLLALAGSLEVFVGGTAITSNVTAKAVGPKRCVLGYVLGAHRLATAAIIVSVVAFFFGGTATRSLVLGFE